MTHVGIGWYRKDQWEDLRRIATDKERIEKTWEEWIAVAEKKMIELMKEGYTPQKVPVDVSELELWCKTSGKQCDGKARAEFITRQLRAKG
jgi:hypothetical protein